jgi:Mg-chelatase subunit ChlD
LPDNVPGVNSNVPAVDSPLSRAQVADVAAKVALVNKPSRLLAVIDVSGSMAAAVPGDPGQTRISLARDAADEGLKILPANTVAGLWRFSADLTSTTDYQQLVGMAPLTRTTRARLAAAVRGLDYVPAGGTGLYDTVLAAVRTVGATYDPSRVNSVVLLTDGKDEADANHRIALQTLLTALDTERRSSRPVKVVSIAYGPDSDTHALRLISAASGGAFYDSTDPRALPTIFGNAIGRRLCQHSC